MAGDSRDEIPDLFREMVADARVKLGIGRQDPDPDPKKKVPAKELVGQLTATLERVMESAAFIGEVVGVLGDQKDNKTDVIVSCGGRTISVKPLPGAVLKAGDMVKLAPNSSQIIGVISRFSIGSVCTVRKIVDESYAEVDFNGAARVVLKGQYGERVQTDDRVILDTSGSIIVAYLGKSGHRFQLGSKPTVTWDDICGLDEAKRQLQEMIEASVKFPGLYKYYQIKQPNGALVSGPPGCGKTMLLEAVASAIVQLYGGEALESGFINVKGSEILDMYVGNTERNVRSLFILGKRHKEKYGYPAVIVIDEADAILSRRGSGATSDMEKTVVPTFLAEMTGIDDSSAIVFLATNRPDVLDPAVIRDKRLDRNILVGRPERRAVEAILRLRLKAYPVRGDVEELVSASAQEFYSDVHKIYEITRRNGDKSETLVFKLSDLANGAMVAALGDDKGVWRVFQRDKVNGGGADPAKRSGITRDGLMAAVADTFKQKFSLNHKDELSEFVADFKGEVVGINKVRLSQEFK